MSADSSIILGVVSGLLASFLIYLGARLFDKVLLPWYRELIYRGIDISGQWQTKTMHPSGNIEDSVMHVTQKAEKLSCVVTIAKKLASSDDVQIKTYQFTGELRERFVALVGRNIDRRSLGTNVTLLEIVGDGKTMKGCDVWYSTTNKTIQSNEIVWVR
jgi:hypothetical protein